MTSYQCAAGDPNDFLLVNTESMTSDLAGCMVFDFRGVTPIALDAEQVEAVRDELDKWLKKQKVGA